ncbi:MAG: glycosyltransferase [Thermodesulfobacteriota bacterium]
MTPPGASGLRLCVVGESGSIHIRRWLRFFADRGHRVHLVTVSPPEPGDIPGVAVHAVRARKGRSGPWKALDYAALALGFRQAVRFIAPDLVNVMFVTDFGLFGALSGVRPLAVTPWGSDVLRHPFQKRFWRLSNAFAVRRADLVVANSGHMHETLVSRLGASEKKILDVVWPGVDFRLFFPRDRAAAKRKLGLEGKLVFFSSRNLSPIYNIDRLLEMFALVRRRLPEAVLLQAGEGPLLAPLRKKAEELGLGEGGRFLGRISQEQVREHLCASDVYLTVPQSDTTATSLLEAFACRCNVVASAIPANREWITSGKNGFLVVPENVDEFAETCVRAALSPVPEAERDANLEKVRALGDHFRNMERIEAEFAALAARSRRSA